MKVKNKVIVSILISIVIVLINSQVFATTLDIKEAEKTEAYKVWEAASDEEKAKLIEPRKYKTSGSSLNITNNPIKAARLQATVTDSFFCLDSLIPENLRIKNQGQTNTCWTFASLAGLESTLALADYYANRPVTLYDFSERHMEYATTRTFKNGEINPIGFSRELDSAGSNQVSYSYFMNGTGPVLEEDMPFVNSKEKIALSELKGEPAAQVYDTRIFVEAGDGSSTEFAEDEKFEDLKAQIKNFLVTYGGVECAIHVASDPENIVNFETGAIYCDTQKPIDHDVLIIGWDDNYSKDNFKEGHRPVNDGAWIIKNSWGERNGYHGYMYLSYDDLTARQLLSGIEKASATVNYDNVYQYNFYGYSYAISIEGSAVMIGNKFTRDSSVEDEYINAVQVLLEEPANCAVFIDPTSDELNVNRLVKATVKGEDENGYIASNAGYRTFELAEPIKVSSDGFSVAIVVRENDEDNKVNVVLENNLASAKYADYATVETGKTFLYDSGSNKWVDLGRLNEENSAIMNGDSTIKAYTKIIEDQGTEEPTEPPVDNPTEDPVEDPTEDPTQDPPTDPTGDPTEDPTEDPVDEPEPLKIAKNSDFTDAKAEIKTVSAYTFSNDSKKNYETIDVLVSGIKWATGNDSMKYQYYISSNPSEKYINDWIDISDVSKVGDSISFVIKTSDVPNYNEIIESDNIYIYLKETSTLGSTTVMHETEGLNLGISDVTTVIYKDGAIQSSTKTSGSIKIDYAKQNANKTPSSRTASTSRVDETVADKAIPQTGETLIIIEAIIVLVVVGTAAFIVMKRTKIK